MSGRILLAQAGPAPVVVVPSPQPSVAPIELIEPDPVFRHAVTLREFVGPLLGGQNVPAPEDVIQGLIGNCPIAAVLVAMAHATPSAITGMITERTAVVRSRRRSDPAGQFPWRTNRLYTVQFRRGSPARISTLLYHDSTGGLIYAHSPNGVGWVSYMEKAYAVFRGANSYNRLNDTTSLAQPPSANQVMEDLAGPFDLVDLAGDRVYPHNAPDVALTTQHLRQVLTRAGQRPKRPTIASTPPGATPPGATIFRNHSYAVLGFRRGRVQLRNPHGGTGAEVSLSLGDFRQQFIAVLQASAAGP